MMFKKDAFEKETKLLRLTKLEPRFKLDLECHLPTKSEDKILSDQWERCLQTSDDKKSNKVKYDKDIKNNYGSGHCNPPITENLGDFIYRLDQIFYPEILPKFTLLPLKSS